MPSDEAEYQGQPRLTKKSSARKVAEAAVDYVARGSGDMPKTTISSKNQITLPARLVREMRLEPGDQLAVEYDQGRLILWPRPKDWLTYAAGALKGMYGKTKEDVDAYLREVRGSWGSYADDGGEDESESE